MMFQPSFTSALFVALLQLGVSITSVNGLHLYSQPGVTQPLLPSRRSVYNPNITSPVQSTVWKVWDRAEVTWDIRDMPKGSGSQETMVVLGWIEPGSSNEHLDVDHPLAKGIQLSSRRAAFTVPNVPPRNNYIVVVFGDSGNCSPTFSIIL